jgi:hypothetical protein
MKILLYVLAFAFVLTNVAQAGQSNKVLICHATSSVKNPVVLISVSENAVEAQLAQGSTFATLLEDGSYTCEVIIAPL